MKKLRKSIKNIVIIALSIIVILLTIISIGTIRHILRTEYLEKYIPLDQALQEIEKHSYTKDYKCLNFSEDLVKKLKEKNIQAEIEIGYNGTNRDVGHAWVGIWFEPQTGTFTNNYQKEENESNITN